MHTRKKWKSSFRIIKYSVSWGSQCWKKQAPMRKNTSFFSSLLHRFFVKNRRKIVQNAWKASLCTKISKNNTHGTLFFSKNTIFSEFLGYSRILRGLAGGVGKSSKSLSSLIHGLLRLKTRVDGLREASGRLPRCLQASPGYDFALILGSILISKTNWKMQKVFKINWKILKNSWTCPSKTNEKMQKVRGRVEGMSQVSLKTRWCCHKCVPLVLFPTFAAFPPVCVRSC